MIDRLEQEVDMLSRHFRVLELVLENEPIGIVRMSNETGYEHHKVRYSLRVLEEEQLIEPTNNGAIATDQTSEFVADVDEKLDTVSDKLQEMQIGTELEVGH
jgi:predicted transcriptional regulator